VTALRSLAIVVVLLGVSGSVAHSSGASAAQPPTPVPSLEPAKTAALWKSLVAQNQQPHPARAQAACRPLRAVLYAASDWLRLATKLAAARSPCADYSISVPPLVADKTQFRRDQASRIRALGPNFHALAEVHFATWTRWVASTGSSWHTAGVTARQHMAEAGYDVTRGDGWALNELTTAVRRGDGNARANIREFLRGLYEGDGSRPTKGAALVIGFGQRTSDLTTYQSTMQSWLGDSEFWNDVATYVSDWSQEVYGDIRAHAVPGEATSVRGEYLNDYLQHPLALASAGPPEIESARSFLRSAYSPLANAAWPRETAWGWTMVPADQMAAYISAQVDALRSYSVASGQPQDHWGFAWAPRNTTGVPDAEFAAQTGQLLDRLAAAIRDSAAGIVPETTETGACGPGETLCALDLPDARHNEAWRNFRTWSQSTLAIGTAPAALVAGIPSSLLRLTVQAVGTRPFTVTLRSSSAAGTFSTSPAGPWSPSLTLTVAPGAVAMFSYRDTHAGRATLQASAPGTTQATRDVTIVAGPATRVTVTPASREIRARGVAEFRAVASDTFGNAATAGVGWSVTPPALGRVVRKRQNTVEFRAGRVLGMATVTATASGGTVAGSAAVVVRPGALRIGSVVFRGTARGVEATVDTVDGVRKPVSQAALTLVVRVDGRRVARERVTTGAAGKGRVLASAGTGCYTVSVTRAVAKAFVWNGKTPRNRFCRP
jgi:hypothetical protein